MGKNVLFNYPSFFSSFGQELFNLVGRSKKSQAEKILKSFDASAAEAQSMMRKAHDLTRSADELMGKAHHECYVGIKKLLDDARAQKFATNLKRMKKGKKGCLSRSKRLWSECGKASASGHAEGEQRPSSTNPEVDVSMQDIKKCMMICLVLQCMMILSRMMICLVLQCMMAVLHSKKKSTPSRKVRLICHVTNFLINFFGSF